ncbi:EAL domain-containing protein [Tahibacter amnicola]|uniref:EAL domain-containing protein n=1 Tax=Tahibacter amnicola TaxID=2976241 RepID=A0ABY6B9U0_9GAMM|nr:EAL domain-containing protein [Tahibacter amnicola]UXI66444.1 EAL domain-containing protein [Tahibacter amnicola]
MTQERPFSLDAWLEEARSRAADAAERDLVMHLHRLHAALDVCSEALCIIDVDRMRFVYANAATMAMLDCTREYLLARGPADFAIEPADVLREKYEAVFQGSAQMHRSDLALLTKDRTLIDVEVMRHRLHYEGRRYIVSFARDVTERRQSERALRAHARRQDLAAQFGQLALSAASPQELMPQAAQIALEALSADFTEIFELTGDESGLRLAATCGGDSSAVGQSYDTRALATQDDEVRVRIESLIVDDFDTETRFMRSASAAQGGVRSAVLVPITGPAGLLGVFGAYSRTACAFSPESVAYLQTISSLLGMAISRKHSDDRASFLAQFDRLTRLPNRDLFLYRIEQSLASAERLGRQAAIIYLQICRFAALRDRMGHESAERLLLAAARRIEAALRGDAILGRLGADEFGVLLAPIDGPNDVLAQATAIQSALAVPVVVDGSPITVAATCGMAVYPKDSPLADELLRNAQAAMVGGRDATGCSMRFFDEALNARTRHFVGLQSDLRRAIANSELELVFQPQAQLESGRIVAVEALLRWHHPARGLLRPADFIEVAEEIGLIADIGRWTLNQACAQLALWRRAGYTDLAMAVNVSALEFHRGHLLAEVSQALHRHSLPASALELELTESVTMEGHSGLHDVLLGLRQLGVTLTLDDFGTGYSSLKYLRQFPVDKIKIDRAFVTDVSTDTGDASIVRAVIAMAHQLHLKVVAEGVETAEQAGFLHRNHCDFIQGYFVSAPVSGAEFPALIASRVRPTALWTAKTTGRSLLLVDDEPAILKSLHRCLRRDGYEIHLANSAAEALALLARSPIDVIVSDYRMPNMTGTEFLSRVRQLYPDTVRMVLSGYADIRAISSAVNDGAVFKYLMKPWSDEDLRQEIRLAFRERERQTGGEAVG